MDGDLAAHMTGQERYLNIMRRRDSELILTAAQLLRMVQHEDQQFSEELLVLAERLDTLGIRLRPNQDEQMPPRDHRRL